jgi:glycerol-3-phosphate dehydrogenase (NAD(P)+)
MAIMQIDDPMTTPRKHVLILGYGEMGHAMQTLLGDRHALHFWDKAPTDEVPLVSFEAAAPQADVVLFCLPVNPHREIATRILPLLKTGCIAISIAKGLDESGQIVAQIFADIFGDGRIGYALLHGPMISEELRAGRPGFAQLGSSSAAACEAVLQLFAGSALLITPSDDINGINWSVVLKNVYAMVFGMADELGLGDNMRGFLMVAAMRELDAIVHLLGGTAGSSYHLAGLGDLVTTATSEDSHHHELGRKLARGDRSEISGEGVHTLQMVVKHGVFAWQEYALFSLIHDIVLEQREPADAITGFMHRDLAE